LAIKDRRGEKWPHCEGGRVEAGDEKWFFSLKIMSGSAAKVFLQRKPHSTNLFHNFDAPKVSSALFKISSVAISWTKNNDRNFILCHDDDFSGEN
jgi:hypothetical protein